MRGMLGKALNLFNAKALPNKTIWAYCLPLFFWFLADSAMSYIFPIVVENHVNSNTILGIIMALSSLAGLIADFTFPQLLKNKTWKFQLLASVALTFLFPLSLTLGTAGSLMYLFIFGSIVWGIYWEFMNFSQQNYVVDEEKSGQYSKDWGIMYLVYQVTTVIGPILGSLLIVRTLMEMNLTIIAIQAFCLIFTIFLIFWVPNKKPSRANQTTIKEAFNLLRELKYWQVLTKSVWTIMLAAVTLTTIDAVFWTIGGLFGQTLFSDGLDWIVIVLFSLPTIIGALILTKIIVKQRKKRLSQVFLLIGSIFLAFLYFAKGSTPIILFLIVMASFSLSFVGPLNEAVFSDLLDRLKEERLHLLGIDKANASFAYVVGPLISGILADKLDYLQTFTLVGVFGIVVAIILLILTPKKLKLRQTELHEVHPHLRTEIETNQSL